MNGLHVKFGYHFLHLLSPGGAIRIKILFVSNALRRCKSTMEIHPKDIHSKSGQGWHGSLLLVLIDTDHTAESKKCAAQQQQQALAEVLHGTCLSVEFAEDV